MAADPIAATYTSRLAVVVLDRVFDTTSLAVIFATSAPLQLAESTGAATATAQRLTNLRAQIVAAHRSADVSTSRRRATKQCSRATSSKTKPRRPPDRVARSNATSLRCVTSYGNEPSRRADVSRNPWRAALGGLRANDALQAACTSNLISYANQHENDTVDNNRRQLREPKPARRSCRLQVRHRRLSSWGSEELVVQVEPGRTGELHYTAAKTGALLIDRRLGGRCASNG